MATKQPSFSTPRRIEADYRRTIDVLMARYFPSDATPQRILNAFANLSRNKSVLEDLATRIAGRMVTQLKFSNERSWREAAAKSSRGREIYEAIQREMKTGVGVRTRELVAENARLISSIPDKVREHVDLEISKMEREGLRPEAVAEYVRKIVPRLTKNHAALIARTEVGKSATALTRSRSEDLGIPAYQWETSRDSRVRQSHRLMQGVIVFWDDPPSPEALARENSRLGHYHAGGAPNCRCDSYPLVNLDVVSWPERVYRSGSIRRYTRAAYERLAGIRRAA